MKLKKLWIGLGVSALVLGSAWGTLNGLAGSEERRLAADARELGLAATLDELRFPIVKPGERNGAELLPELYNLFAADRSISNQRLPRSEQGVVIPAETPESRVGRTLEIQKVFAQMSRAPAFVPAGHIGQFSLAIKNGGGLVVD